jgi:hypothetical protein
MTQLKAGLRLKSAVCDAEVMIIKTAGGETLACGGVPMLASGDSADGAEADAAQMEGCQIGKRYVNGDDTLEVLCVKGGQGSLAAEGQALTVKGAKKLPSSD